MSTRGTYLFKNGDEWTPDVCLYVHHDNYESGAAYKLYQAWLAGGNMTPESFIRGNDRAEFTHSHDAHGDTEYRYTFHAGNLLVENRKPGSDNWRKVFNGDWVVFVNENIDLDWVPDFQPLKRLQVESYNGNTVYSPKSLKAALDEKLRLCGMWATNGNGLESCNAKNLLKEIADMKDALKTFGPPAWKEAA